MQIFWQNFKITWFLSRKTKNVQISFDRMFSKNLQFFSQNLCNLFPYVKGFPKSKILSKSDKWKWVKTKIWFVTGKSSHSGCVPEDSDS